MAFPSLLGKAHYIQALRTLRLVTQIAKRRLALNAGREVIAVQRNPEVTV